MAPADNLLLLRRAARHHSGLAANL